MALQTQQFKALLTQTHNIQEQFAALHRDISELHTLTESTARAVVPNKKSLLEHLELTKGDFQYYLALKGVLQNPVCKGKYFSFEIALVSKQVPFPETEKLNVSLYVYSAESVPRLLTRNVNGHKIARGATRAVLRFDRAQQLHCGTFKIQLNEVTSHFKNGWVFLVVIPDELNDFLRRSGRVVGPLVIDHLVSKAKEVTCAKWRENRRVSDIDQVCLEGHIKDN